MRPLPSVSRTSRRPFSALALLRSRAFRPSSRPVQGWRQAPDALRRAAAVFRLYSSLSPLPARRQAPRLHGPALSASLPLLPTRLSPFFSARVLFSLLPRFCLPSPLRAAFRNAADAPFLLPPFPSPAFRPAEGRPRIFSASRRPPLPPFSPIRFPFFRPFSRPCGAKRLPFLPKMFRHCGNFAVSKRKNRNIF